MSKRPAAVSAHKAKEMRSKKQKVSIPSSSSLNSATIDDLESYDKTEDWTRDLTWRLEEFSGSTPFDERREINREVEDGSHVLILEYNMSKSAKCRATTCIINDEFRQYDERIHSPYRFCLEAMRPGNAHWSQLEKPNRRFYHISCLEAIGVDIASHLTLPPERRVRPGFRCIEISRQDYHPAIIDWVTNKGRSFNAKQYSKYEEHLESYYTEVDDSLRVHLHTCSAEKCGCASPPTRPESSEFIEGEPSRQSLSEILLQVLGADQPMLLPRQIRLMLLDLEFSESRWERILAQRDLQRTGKENHTEKATGCDLDQVLAE